MKIKEFIKVDELEDGEISVRGQLVVRDPSVEPKDDEVLGVAAEDIKKGQVGSIKL